EVERFISSELSIQKPLKKSGINFLRHIKIQTPDKSRSDHPVFVCIAMGITVSSHCPSTSSGWG
ncbi:hypothetical protein, partial [Haliscomenobacter sp.]|uniref:hypothetical protein n=1 Tax=Haliscomenobacter sp. TaxID=2717303 RepID=UPI00336517DC